MVDEGVEVVVVDVLHDVEALGRGADLAGVEEGGPGAAPRRDLDLAGDVRADDERVLAAHLEVDARDALRARAAIRLPVSTEPVNATQSTRSSATIAAPTSPAPASRLTTPRAGARSSGASTSVESGVSSEGLQTRVLPAASAGASFHASSSSG